MTMMLTKPEVNSNDVEAACDEHRWQAVLARDARCDGEFVYAVNSTGVYCRPTCPSKRPGREQVEFFADARAAERAGYRACLRCKPQGQAISHRIAAACRAIEQDGGEPPALAELAGLARMSPYHFQRMFKRMIGVTPMQYAAHCRQERLRGALRQGRGVATATFLAGYGSSSRVYERADDKLGMTPATYGRGGAGQRIVFTITGCPLGRLLVAATPKGVCAIELDDDDASLRRELDKDFFAATIEPDGGRLRERVRRIVAYLQDCEPDLHLPLDIRATAFQQRVWQELQAIPRGEQRTYSEIACAIGHPSAARAVGQACASNPVALAIPCHRAVGADGGLGGYRWGITRKTKLLELERRRGQAASA